MHPYDLITIWKDEEEHLYVQLYKNLRMLIFNNVIKPHDKLPPIRKLAENLGVNNVTVVNAYKLLEEDSLVYKKTGSGTFVAPVEDENVRIEDNIPGMSTVPYDFSISSPTADLFPVSDFKTVINEVLERDKGYAFGYHDSQGYLPFRQSLAMLSARIGIAVDASQIQIISGAQQGIDLVAKSVLDYGDCVFVEGPTYTGALASFKLKGASIVEIPLEEDGIDIDLLRIQAKKYRPKLIYVMPNFQNPTGICYSIEKKKALVEIAKSCGAWILEDDYAADLNIGHGPLEPLSALGLYDRVIYVKSFSKVLMPGLRLGFMIVPGALSDEIALAKHATDITTSGLLQRAFDLYIRKGLWDKQMTKMKKIYSRRHSAMTLFLAQNPMPGLHYQLPRGGYNYWLTMPLPHSADELTWRLQKKGVAILSGSVFYHLQVKSPSFRISIAAISEKEINKGMTLIFEEMHLMQKEIDGHSLVDMKFQIL
ncbi:MAG: PLP-dependent aminotransferase family protein [Erysipelotrichaceae bacterium]|nr:PLP-dependent aminotransferase family protein [Erysipelotrichaceae bacterium]